LQFVRNQHNRERNQVVILSERSESKDPGTNFSAIMDKLRRFLDSLRSLEMTPMDMLNAAKINLRNDRN
jgi:hypothetical protein